MRDYETTFILVPTLDEDGVKNEIESVKKVITSEGGEITAEKEWGRRRLAYPLRDHSEGVYHILRFSAAPRFINELNRYFRLNENVLRALVIQDEGTPLEYLGQTSEFEERERDFRDRRPDSRSGRYGRSEEAGRRSPQLAPVGAPPEATKTEPGSEPNAEAEGEKTSE
jgi:small subunit ribosomal protein S6